MILKQAVLGEIVIIFLKILFHTSVKLHKNESPIKNVSEEKFFITKKKKKKERIGFKIRLLYCKSICKLTAL